MISIDRPVMRYPEIWQQMRQASQARPLDVAAADRLALQVAGQVQRLAPTQTTRLHRVDIGAVAHLIK